MPTRDADAHCTHRWTFLFGRLVLGDLAPFTLAPIAS